MNLIKPYVSLVKVATPNDTVLNTECVFTFYSPFTKTKGIVVNMCTFIGTVEEMALKEAKNGIFLRIVKEKKERARIKDLKEKKVSKLGIGVEGGFESEDSKYEILENYSIVILRRTGSGIETVVELSYNDASKSNFPLRIVESADSIINHSGWAIQHDIKAWELDVDMIESKHCFDLPFVENGVMISPNHIDWKCEKSGDTENLWLNLSDGYIGGGRKNWDGSGGSNGALEHFLETGEKYPLVVKLGTITGDIETADCYSYAKDEDCPVKIPNLELLLQKRGIRMSSLSKTVKSTYELEVELNASYAFDEITESGANLISVSGPGLQGLQNLGNSCYINSVTQVLFNGCIPELASRYGVKSNGKATIHPFFENIKTENARTSLITQTVKLSIALTSGVYAKPSPTLNNENQEYRIAPRMFKHAIAKDHADFRTNLQQDAAQFLQFLLESLDRAELAGAFESDRLPNLFTFKTTRRVMCTIDNLVKYSYDTGTILNLRIPIEDITYTTDSSSFENHTDKRQKSESLIDNNSENLIPEVSFESCLNAWAAPTQITDYRWPHLNNIKATANVSVRFSNFPRYLIIQLERYTLSEDWTPKKLEVKVQMPQVIDLDYLKCKGPQEGESLVPEVDTNELKTSKPTEIDEIGLEQLMEMGFSCNGCKRALKAVGSDVEAAMNWIFEHNNDPDFNDPIPETFKSTISDEVDDNVVMSLVDNLGCFTVDQVRASLKETNGSVERAADWLFSHMDDLDTAIANISSINQLEQTSSESKPSSLEDGPGKYSLFGLISHIGKNTNSGHYVCHLKKDGKWVIFNDEKVAISEAPPFEHAYIYFYKQVGK